MPPVVGRRRGQVKAILRHDSDRVIPQRLQFAEGVLPFVIGQPRRFRIVGRAIAVAVLIEVTVVVQVEEHSPAVESRFGRVLRAVAVGIREYNAQNFTSQRTVAEVDARHDVAGLERHRVSELRRTEQHADVVCVVVRRREVHSVAAIEIRDDERGWGGPVSE